MAKKGMKRPSPKQNGAMNNHKNDVEPVPEIEGKAKTSKEKAGRI